ncbi:serine/arginine repetitive matrix protein 1 isoform X3 [Helicoverpa armigera]|uniref:serine/arginine repetitive matrix protein 1 isoform X3 n=1 Tax=Helicoverpa armigera TaxID=29058 RepID=UPI003082F9E2
MKYANIMCERAPELAESPHAAPAWPSLREPLRCPPEEALWTFPGVDRAPRSRSSPVRTNIEEESIRTGRQRCPSASPRPAAGEAAAAAAAAEAARAPPAPRLPPARLPHPGVVTAYYSLRPPAAPLRLVAASRRVPPALPPHSCTSSPPLPCAAPIDDERCKNVVRSVLCELMSGLPMSAASSPERRARLPRVQGFVPRSRSPHSRSPSVRSPLSRSPHSRYPQARSATPLEAGDRLPSTGAHTPILRDSSVRSEGCHLGVAVADGGDEWLGGVRALRDSHVRLVLRQLRHIERLNRALDRAARPAQPARPAHRPLQ